MAFAAALAVAAAALLHVSCGRQGAGGAASAPEGSVIVLGSFERDGGRPATGGGAPEGGAPKSGAPKSGAPDGAALGLGEAGFSARLCAAARSAELPDALRAGLLESAARSPAFERELAAVLAGPRWLRVLVDKERALPSGYSPPDLVALSAGGPYRASRPGLMLRRAAAQSLAEMALAARADGVTLVASSAYRSYAHQAQVHSRLVRQMGRAAAERVSARPGHSQHQLGLALDFGCITDAFAQTAAGRWMDANAGRFGWSLSYPYGYESVTGYAWESWHFRYLGRELADFKESHFGGIQQFALRFLHEWELGAAGPP